MFNNQIGFLILITLLISSLVVTGYAADPTKEDLKQRIAALELERDALRTESVTFKTLAKHNLRYEIRSRPLHDETTIGSANGLVTLLKITDQERLALNKAIRETREKIAAQIAKQKPQAEKTPNGYKLVTKDFTAEGEIIERDYKHEIETILGADRANLMNKVTEQYDFHFHWFYHFGSYACIYTMILDKEEWKFNYEGHCDKNGIPCSEGSTIMPFDYELLSLLKPFWPPEAWNSIEKIRSLLHPVRKPEAAPPADDVHDF